MRSRSARFRDTFGFGGSDDEHSGFSGGGGQQRGRVVEAAFPVKGFVGGVAVGVALTVGLASKQFLALTSSGSAEDKLLESVTLFEEVVTELQREYVDEVDPRRLFTTGVNAMLQLDPCRFESLRAAQDMRASPAATEASDLSLPATDPSSIRILIIINDDDDDTPAAPTTATPAATTAMAPAPPAAVPSPSSRLHLQSRRGGRPEGRDEQ